MIRVKSYTIPPKGFAPYDYVLKHIPDLHERYAELARNIGSQDDLQTPDFGPLTAHICWNTSGLEPIDIKEVISKRALSATKLRTESDYSSLRAFLESSEANPTDSVSLVVLNEDFEGIEEIRTVKDLNANIIFIIIVDDRNKSKGNVNKFKPSDVLYYSVYFTRKEKINNDIGDLLERKVLQSIKTQCENVSEWLSEKKRSDSEHYESKYSKTESRKRKAFLEADSKIQGKSFPKRSCTQTTDTLGSTSLESVELASNLHDNTSQERKGGKGKGIPNRRVEKGEQSACTYAKLDVQRVNLDTTERLLAEILALYSTSNVPERDLPITRDYQLIPISKKIKTDIFELDPSIKGMGYRFSRYIIYIAETKNKKADQNLRKSIEDILDSHNITDFTIEVVSKELQNYGCDVRVGSGLMTPEKKIKGTLGCFANMKKNNECKRCALLSNHVAIFSERFKYSSGETNECKPLGDIVQETVSKNALDMAAMALEKQINICAKFRMEDVYVGEVNEVDTLQGKLYRYFEDQDAVKRGILQNGQRVYIWGAISNPGKGVITMCDYNLEDMKSLIQIEDRIPKDGEIKRFCKPGDSGAIICAEDSRGNFVHLIGMLIGEICTGKYLALPLSRGLEELEERAKSTFEILQLINE